MKLVIDSTDPDSFWKVMEVILGEKAQLNQKEITNFVALMKKVRLPFSVLLLCGMCFAGFAVLFCAVM